MAARHTFTLARTTPEAPPLSITTYMREPLFRAQFTQLAADADRLGPTTYK